MIVAGKSYGKGEGTTKKEAEQKAAESAYMLLKQEIAGPRRTPRTDAQLDERAPPGVSLPELPRLGREWPDAGTSRGRSGSAGLGRTRGRPHRRTRRGAAPARGAQAPARCRRFRGPAWPGAPSQRARRRGKYLWLELADVSPAEQALGDAVIAHLGMSGQMLVQPVGTADETHLRIRVRFADDGPELRFVDQRTFGGAGRERTGRRRRGQACPSRSRTSPAIRWRTGSTWTR